MKTIIEMAEKAFETPGVEPAFRNGFWTVTLEELERFAELVRAEAQADEREACARLAEEWLGPPMRDKERYIAAAIRARGHT